MNTALFISAFVLGISSSFHCLGMCGPMVMAVPFSQSKLKHLHLTIYLLSKAIAYAIMGSVLGILGLGLFLFEWQQMISIVAGIMILVVAFYPILKNFKAISPFRNTTIRLFQKISQEPKWYYYPMLGFLNGWLPCGMVYVALTTALISGDPIDGGVAMFLFGIGTAPVLFLTVVLKNRLSMQWRLRLKPMTTILTVTVGLLLILRGLNLGIPILSPHLDIANEKVDSCCV